MIKNSLLRIIKHPISDIVVCLFNSYYFKEGIRNFNYLLLNGDVILRRDWEGRLGIAVMRREKTILNFANNDDFLFELDTEIESDGIEKTYVIYPFYTQIDVSALKNIDIYKKLKKYIESKGLKMRKDYYNVLKIRFEEPKLPFQLPNLYLFETTVSSDSETINIQTIILEPIS